MQPRFDRATHCRLVPLLSCVAVRSFFFAPPSSDSSSLLPLRPQLAAQTHGETAWGGVPQRLDGAVPGQGVSLPRTTAFEEVGQPYKPHEHNRTEAFRAAVGGIKVGYGGHVPGERNHFGSNHQGQLPRVEYSEPAQSHASLRGPLSEGEIRKMEFEPAWHLAQATGTAKQHFEVHHRSGRSAPFGLDSTNAPYVTEQSRPLGTGGPRGQLMTRANGGSSRAAAPEGASGGVLSEFHGLQRHAAGAARAQPGAVAQSLYDRDVNGQRAVRVSEFVYSPPHALPLAVGNASGNADLTQHAGSASIGLQHSASPGSRAGSRLNQFINGAGAMDDWVDAPHAGFPAPPDVTASRAMRARQPSHAYETEMLNPRGSYHLSQSRIEREAPRRGIVGGGDSTPPPQQGDKYRSRISSNQRDSAPPSPVPFDVSPQPTGGGGSNPFSSRLFSPQSSQRASPAGGMRGAASGVDQVRLYGGGSGAGSRAGTPSPTPPLTPNGLARSHGRASGTRYASDTRGSPPVAQPQQRSQVPPTPAWQGVPAIRGGYWGGGARAASPRAWRREEANASLYEA